MIALLLTFLITYFATFLFGYVVHWSLHQPWIGSFNESHMVHHMKLYPPEDYASDEYRSAGKDSTVWFFVGASVPMVAAPILLAIFGIISIPCMIVSVVTMLGLGFLHNYVHDAFHVQHHWMSRVPYLKDIFHNWNHLHYLHHVDMDKNYGIFAFYWDRLFGTFWDVKSLF